jgi:hypothetical protein
MAGCRGAPGGERVVPGVRTVVRESAQQVVPTIAGLAAAGAAETRPRQTGARHPAEASTFRVWSTTSGHLKEGRYGP